jgi:hypothetical protein
MIRIDLLPPELRGNERTAPGTFLGVIGLVIFVCLSAVGVAWGWFGIVGAARGDVEIAQDQLESKKPRAEYSDRLEAEKKEYSERLDHIRTFSSSRILWTKKIDQLWSLVDTPPEAGRHTIWFDQFAMDMGSARSPALTLKGDSESNKFDRLSAFHSDLKSAAFIADFEGISNPTGEVKSDEDFIPAESCEFEFILQLKDRSLDSKANGKKKPVAKKK